MPISLIPIPIAVDFADADVVGMIFAHPHIATSSTHPFRVASNKREAATATILNCLQYAFEAPVGFPRAHFVVFPELALPFESFAAVDDLLATTACPPNTIVIAGLEWLTAAQYIELLTRSDNPMMVKEKHPDPTLFVNCCAISVKTRDHIFRFLQPKLRPSPSEAATQVMYPGQDVFVFVTPRPNELSFAVLICFDCIAANGEKSMFDQIFEAVPDSDINRSFNLQLLFVPQHNDSPENPSFIDFALTFLNGGGSTLNTADSAVAFVNSASFDYGRADAGYGRSSVYYRAGRWQSIPPDGPLVRVPDTYAVENITNSLMRARFREDGPSLHRFGFVLPWRITRGAGASRIPLTGAQVSKIGTDGTLGAAENISAICKVFTDWCTADLAIQDHRFQATTDLISEYVAVRDHFNTIAKSGSERVGQILDLLLLGFGGPCRRPRMNPDTWQQPIQLWRLDEHGQAIVELAAICSLLALLNGIRVDQESQVRTGTSADLQFVVLDGANQRSHEYLAQMYFDCLDTHPWGEIVGRKILIVMTRVSVLYLNTVNNVAEEIKPHIGELSAEDDLALATISPDLSPQIENITVDSTRFFKHFGTILAQSLMQPTKADAAQFLRERLGQAI